MKEPKKYDVRSKQLTNNEFGLNSQEQAFCEHYLIHLNATEAIYEAFPNSCGTRKTASIRGFKLLQEERIQNYIKYMMQSKNNEVIATQDEVLEFLTDVMRNNYEKAKSNRPFIARDRIACAELLGKRYALFTEKIETTQEVVINVDILED